MNGAMFVTCPDCGRLMLGQRHGEAIYPQPHQCDKQEPLALVAGKTGGAPANAPPVV